MQGSALLRWTKEGTLDMPWVRTLLIADLIHVVQSHELKPPAVEGPGVPEMTKKLVHWHISGGDRTQNQTLSWACMCQYQPQALQPPGLRTGLQQAPQRLKSIRLEAGTSHSDPGQSSVFLTLFTFAVFLVLRIEPPACPCPLTTMGSQPA